MEISEVQDMLSRLATAFVNLSDTAKQVDDLRQEVQNLRDELQSVKADRDHAYQSFYDAENANKALQARVESLTSERDTKQQHSEYLDGLLIQCSNSLRETENKVRECNEHIDAQAREITVLKEQLEAVTKDRDMHRDTANRVRESFRTLLGDNVPHLN